MIKDLFLLIRPHQWLKNFFIFLPLFFHGELSNIPMLAQALIVFVSFCLIASSIYCFNDIYDREADKLHPKKSKRPIAAGRVSLTSAYITMAILVLVSLALVYVALPLTYMKVIGVLLLYFLMNIGYCIYLKNIAIVDVLIIAVGFVLRVIVGGVSISVELSQWIVLMTFLLALFLAFAKRRDDVVIYENTGILPRKNVNRYNLVFMNQAITVISAITMVCYIMYTVSDEVQNRFGSHYVYLTTIFVLAGILRYMQLTIVDVKSGSPTRVLMHDRFMQASVMGWILSYLIIIYF